MSLQTFCRRLAERMQLAHSFSICLVSDQKMRQVNRRFAGQDKATDVLSFPDQAEPWEQEAGESYAGDIFISVESADRQKKGLLEDELKILTLHGLLHLMGYDHEVDDGEMGRLEAILKQEFQLQ